ncbi:unnamed protein product, partial [marine sediment metagenome]
AVAIISNNGGFSKNELSGPYTLYPEENRRGR